MKGLYKVSIKQKQSYMPKKKPIYVIADSKHDADAYVGKYLKSGFEIGKISFLGKQVAGYMFHNN